MLSRDQVRAGITGAVDQVLALIRDHEKEKHRGERCGPSRVVVAAYIASRLGLDPCDVDCMTGFVYHLHLCNENADE